MNKILTYLITASIYLITADAFAGNDTLNPKTILSVYENSLNHENEGVVKSAIQNIMKLQTVYPELNYSKVIKRLEYLATKSDSKKIRFNAYIAVNIFKYPTQLDWNLPNSYEGMDEFFSNYEINFDKPIAQTK
ncbi:MAG: hypothetical protein JW956_00320 [Calditrichaceae bacterium]|nr:hypothetical protein [Calditrichaceae bacterium]